MMERQHNIKELLRAAEAELRANPKAAETIIEGLTRQASDIGELEGHAVGLIFDGNVKVMSGNYVAARPLLQEGLDLSTWLGQPTLQMRALQGLGALHGSLGEFGPALEYQMQGMHLARAEDDRDMLSRTLGNIGNLYMQLHDHEQALKYHQESRDELAQTGRQPFLARMFIATDLEKLGELERACHLREELLAELRQIQSPAEQVFVMADLAYNLLLLDRYAEAQEIALEGLALAEAQGLQVERSQLLITLGSVEARTGELERARLHLEEVLAQKVSALPVQLIAHRELSHLLEAQGDLAAALGHARAFHELERTELRQLSERRSQVLSTQLKVELLRHQAEEKERQNAALAVMNEQLRETQKKLLYAATHDALTGLLVRSALEKTLQDDLRLDSTPLRALFMIDVDHFKHINDSLGHHAGDR